MKTVTQHIRDHLERRAFQEKLPPLESLRKSEWSDEFETLMRNRLIMGAFRYGLFSNPDKFAFRIVESMLARLHLYQRDRNLEHLVDVANLALVEFVAGRRVGLHVHPADDGIHVERRCE